MLLGPASDSSCNTSFPTLDNKGQNVLFSLYLPTWAKGYAVGSELGHLLIKGFSNDPPLVSLYWETEHSSTLKVKGDTTGFRGF